MSVRTPFLPATVRDHPVIARRARELVAKRRAVLLGDEGCGGEEAVGLAAAALATLHTQNRVVVFGSLKAEDKWRACLGVAGQDTVINYLTPQRQAKVPALLDATCVLLVDADRMSRDMATASWQGFAPVLRSAPFVVMYVSRENWPAALAQVELIYHFDGVVLMDQRLS